MLLPFCVDLKDAVVLSLLHLVDLSRHDQPSSKGGLITGHNHRSLRKHNILLALVSQTFNIDSGFVGRCLHHAKIVIILEQALHCPSFLIDYLHLKLIELFPL